MKYGKMAVLAAAFVTVGAFAAAQEAPARVIHFSNGLGGGIPQLTISPAREYDSQSPFVVRAEDMHIGENGSLQVVLPPRLRHYNSFVIAAAYGGDRFATSGSIRLNFTDGTPLLHLSDGGRNPVIGSVFALAAACGVIFYLTKTHSGRMMVIRMLYRHRRNGEAFVYALSAMAAAAGFYISTEIAPGS